MIIFTHLPINEKLYKLFSLHHYFFNSTKLTFISRIILRAALNMPLIMNDTKKYHISFLE